MGKGWAKGVEGPQVRAGQGIRARHELLTVCRATLPRDTALAQPQAKPRKRPFIRQLVTAEVWNELRRQDEGDESSPATAGIAAVREPLLQTGQKTGGGKRDHRLATSGAPRTPLNLTSQEAVALAAAEVG